MFSKNSLRIQKNRKINQKSNPKLKQVLEAILFLNHDFLCDKEKCKQVIDGYVYIDQDHCLYIQVVNNKILEDKRSIHEIDINLKKSNIIVIQ